MYHLILLACTGLLLETATDQAQAEPSRILADYEVARRNVGTDPNAHVRLALWCEAHGLPAQRLKHLALAVLRNPSHATARGLMGLVNVDGRWQRPDLLTDRLRKDEQRTAAAAEYNDRRTRLSNTAEAHWRLAIWCDERGLKPEAMAHYTSVVRLDPGREAAWKRLGCKKHNGRWMTVEQIAEEKAEVEARKQAEKSWRPLLQKWSQWLSQKDKRAEAEAALAEVEDPRAVSSIWSIFAEGKPAQQKIAVRLFGQIDSPSSSRALAMLAVFNDDPEVRRTATETLKRRDPREFVSLLISMIRDPIKYEVRPVGGPGSPGALFVEGKQFNVQRLYSPPPLPDFRLYPGEPVTFDAWGLPVVSRFLGITEDVRIKTTSQSQDLGPYGTNALARFRWTRTTTTTETTRTPIEHTIQIPIGQIYLQYQMSAMAASQQLIDDARQIDDYNAFAKQSNERVLRVLGEVTGQDLGPDQKGWMKWWVDQQGYAYNDTPQDRPTFVEDVPLAYVPQGVLAPPAQAQQAGNPTTTVTTSTGIGHNCFKAGTPVLTLEGLRPIEKIRVGDQLLTQDTQTGALSYQAVLAVYHNKPSPTLNVKAGDESIVSTPIHRFWKAGAGWVMARDLKPGDQLRALDGIAEVTSIGNEPVQPVFNLEVASGQCFFVGERGVLVHDNSLVQPVGAPFDAEPRLETLSRSH